MSARKPRSEADVPWDRLGAREREILEVLFAREEASASDVRAALADPPSYSAVRGMLALLEGKGHVQHRRDGLRYLYAPTHNAARARGSALRKLVDTFFGGSPVRVVSALLDLPDDNTSDMTVAELRKAVLRAKKEGR